MNMYEFTVDEAQTTTSLFSPFNFLMYFLLTNGLKIIMF